MREEYSIDDIKIIGQSKAGIGTCFYIPQIKVAIDTAQGLPFVYPAETLLITHGHIDHAGGLAYIVSQKALMGLKGLKIFCPKENVQAFHQILETWSQIEGFKYDYTLTESEPGKMYPLKGDYFFMPFKTIHRVPSVGYCIFRTHKSLKPEFKNQDPRTLAELAQKGEDLNEYTYRPLFAYTGDTQVEFLEHIPIEMNGVEALFVDCTYLDEKRNVARTREWGHMHLDEILANLHKFKAKKIVLTHISSRYSNTELKQIFNNQIKDAAVKIEFFPKI